MSNVKTAEKYMLKAAGGTKHEVLEVWESFSGWYWYIVEFDKNNKQIAFGFVQGLEEEWGDIYMPDLLALEKSGKAWKVSRKNWAWTGRNTPMEKIE